MDGGAATCAAQPVLTGIMERGNENAVKVIANCCLPISRQCVCKPRSWTRPMTVGLAEEVDRGFLTRLGRLLMVQHNGYRVRWVLYAKGWRGLDAPRDPGHLLYVTERTYIAVPSCKSYCTSTCTVQSTVQVHPPLSRVTISL